MFFLCKDRPKRFTRFPSLPVPKQANDSISKPPLGPINHQRKADRNSKTAGIPPRDNPWGLWYISERNVWYTISEGRRYTYFEGRWYRAHEDQSFKMQRSAGDGSPLLFSGGDWFEEHADGPAVADIPEGERPVSPLSDGDVEVERRPVSPLSDAGEDQAKEDAARPSEHMKKPDDIPIPCDGKDDLGGKKKEDDWGSFHSNVEPKDGGHAIMDTASVSSSTKVASRRPHAHDEDNPSAFAFCTNSVGSLADTDAVSGMVSSMEAALRRLYASDEVDHLTSASRIESGSDAHEGQKAGEEFEPVASCTSHAASSSLQQHNTTSTFQDLASSSSHYYETPITASTSYQPVPTEVSHTQVTAAKKPTATIKNTTTECPPALSHEPSPQLKAQAEKQAEIILKDIATRRDRALEEAKRDRQKNTHKALLTLDEHLYREGRRPAAVGWLGHFLVRVATGSRDYPHLTYAEAVEVKKRVKRDGEREVWERFAREEGKRMRELAEACAAGPGRGRAGFDLDA